MDHEVTPESVVQDLLPHLTHQTTLLPTLHTQLGLASSALKHDLCTLRAALLKTIEDCVHARQKEVQEWADRCEGLEESCLRLSKALGPSAKSVGATVGELRKQSVYPRRFELLTAQEDKLIKLYQSKVEQLNNVTARLTALARTLGSKFFPPDVLQPIPASGERNDRDAWRDVSPDRFIRLEKEIVRGKTEVNRRLAALARTLEHISWLYSELGIPLPTLHDPIPGDEIPYPEPSELPLQGSDPFVVIQPPDPQQQRQEYFPIFARFIARLQEAADEELESEIIGVEGINPSPALVDWFERLKNGLEGEKERREAHIQSIFDQLDGLWRRLGVDDQDVDDFVELHRGSTMTTIQAYENELERMLEMKHEKMTLFIDNARAEIQHLWEDLMMGDIERDNFAAFHDNEHTEDLLTIHEEEINRLKEERRSKSSILASVRKYLQISAEQKELESSAQDQSRLLGRGTRGDPGRLLREEKMRKRVMKEKPKLEQQLLVSVPAWEQEHGRPFLVNGEPFMQLLQEAVIAQDAHRDNKKRQRTISNAPPSRSTTPAPQASVRKGAATPSIRPTSSASNHTNSTVAPATKKQKLNNSTAKPKATPSNSRPVSSSSVMTTSTSHHNTVTRSTSRSAAPANAQPRVAQSHEPSIQPNPMTRTAKATTHAAPRIPLASIPPNTPPQMTHNMLCASTTMKPASPSRLDSTGKVPVTRGLLFPSKQDSTAIAKQEPLSSKATVSPVITRFVPMATSNSTIAPTGDKRRRESFKPRPSSPGLHMPDKWRAKSLIRNELVAELEEDSDMDF